MATRIVETVVEYETQPPCKTAEQMEKICCEATEKLQCCEKYDGVWQGHTAQELLEKYHPDLDALGRDSQGRQVVIELSPRKNPCGEKVTEYDTSLGNCCDEIAILTWDSESTPDILPAGSSVVIYAIGGQAPYTFKTTANQTSFVDGRKTLVTSSPYAKIFAGSSFCGATSVTVSDGCTVAQSILRSDTGQWVLVSVGDCVMPGCESEAVGAGDGLIGGQMCMRGNLMQIEQYAAISSRPDFLGYFAGIAIVDGEPDICPGRSGAGCMDTEETLIEAHCRCAREFGVPQILKPLCVGLPADFYTCDDDFLLAYGGGIGFYCPKSGASGAAAGYRAIWYESELLHTYQWVC